MKTKHTFIIFALGFLINIIGAFFKITRWSNANLFFAIGSVLGVIGALLFFK